MRDIFIIHFLLLFAADLQETPDLSPNQILLSQEVLVTTPHPKCLLTTLHISLCMNLLYNEGQSGADFSFHPKMFACR